MVPVSIPNHPDHMSGPYWPIQQIFGEVLTTCGRANRRMNRGLLIISMVLIVAGLASSIIPLVIIGVFLILPALASGRRARREPRVTPRPLDTSSTSTTWAREMPERPAQPSPPAEALSHLAQPANYSSSTSLSPLFQTQMFPTLNPIQQLSTGQEQLQEKEEFPKELLEIGAVFLLAKLLSKRRH